MPANFFSDGDTTTVVGSLSVTNSVRTGQKGTLSFDNSSATSDGSGNLTLTSIIGAINASRNTGTAPTLASSGTITPAGLVARVTTGGAVTGAIIANGTTNGQLLIVVNESANTITMATAATSHVASGTTNVIVANGGALYVWDDQATTPRWYCVGMGL